MKKNIKIYIIILTIFSLLSLENARAAEAEIEKRVNNGDLSGYIEEISGISNENGPIAICVYACSAENSTTYEDFKIDELNDEQKQALMEKYGVFPTKKVSIININSEDNYGKCGPEEEKFNYITYDNYNKNLPWGVYTGQTTGIFKTDIEFSSIEFSIAKWETRTMHQTSIYYGAGKEEDEEWDVNSESYKNLTESFICPKYVYYDETQARNEYAFSLLPKNKHHDYMEVCYDDGDSNDSCTSKNRQEEKTTFKNKNKLVYSFAEEMNNILFVLETDISNFSDKEILSSSTKIKEFANSTDDEFLENMCKIISSSADEEELAGNIMQNPEEDFNNLVTNAYKKTYVGNYTSPNAKSLNIDTIVNFLDKNKKAEKIDIRYNGVVLRDKYEKINDTYAKNLAHAAVTYQEKCKSEKNYTFETDFNEEKLSQQLKLNINKMAKDIINVDTRTKFDCGILSEFASEIKTGYFIIEMLSIVLIVALSALDYAKIIMNDNQDEFKKENKKLVRRIILLVSLFLLPAILNFILGIFHIEGFNSDDPLCTEKINKESNE